MVDDDVSLEGSYARAGDEDMNPKPAATRTSRIIFTYARDEWTAIHQGSLPLPAVSLRRTIASTSMGVQRPVRRWHHTTVVDQLRLRATRDTSARTRLAAFGNRGISF